MYCRLILFILLSGMLSTNTAQIPPGGLARTKGKEVLIECRGKPSFRSDLTQLDKVQRGIHVFETLMNTANASQHEVKKYLHERRIPYRAFCIANVICARLTEAEIADLSRFDQVKQISFNETFQLEPYSQAPFEKWKKRSADFVPWGIRMIKADQVWELGVRGQGVIIGGQDTGYDYLHPAITKQYRGWTGQGYNHAYNWFDAISEISPLHEDENPGPDNNPCGLQSMVPCDDNNHGTHTMGTMVGDLVDSSWHIGVAPEARWIGVRNMERGYGSPQTYLAGFEWFLAPTDENNANPNPALAPHVINNSWSCPEKEGCFPENFHLLEDAVNNLRAAGIVVVVSAGNNGRQGCQTISTPAAIFEGSFTVGATHSGDTITNFSSRGPVVVDGSNRIKPNVTAPGQGVLSAVKDGRFASLSGTSMSGPHVAGLVALIISANPSLAGQVETIEHIIEHTAVQISAGDTCNITARADGQNTTYGFGRIDALAAVEMAMTTVSIKDLETIRVTITPNPSHTIFAVDLPDQHDFILQVYNMQGQIIYHSSMVDSQPIIIPANSWPSGTYVLMGRSTRQVFSEKLVKL